MKTKTVKPATKSIVIGMIVFSLLFAIVYGASKFFDTYKLTFQFPVIIRPPVIVEKRILKIVWPEGLTPLPSEQPTPPAKKQTLYPEAGPSDLAIIEGKKHAEILKKIYVLESSSGKNDGCRKQDKYNGFGFGQSKVAWNCFDYFEEVAHKVDAWFDRELATKSLPEALCYYNEGIVKNNCPYYQKFLSI